jgi:hypothetical protein
MFFSGAWGKMIHEKKPKQKPSDTVPLSLETSSSSIIY